MKKFIYIIIAIFIIVILCGTLYYFHQKNINNNTVLKDTNNRQETIDGNEKLSFGEQEYLMLLDEADKNPIAHDGGVIVPYETIRQRINKYENFLEKYPDFNQKEDVKEQLDFLYYIYRYGLDNTPIHCDKNNSFMLEENRTDVKNSYKNFLNEYKDKESNYYKEIKSCYDKL